AAAPRVSPATIQKTRERARVASPTRPRAPAEPPRRKSAVASISPAPDSTERHAERLRDFVDEDELQAAELPLGNLLDVSRVSVRHDHPLDPRPLRRQALLL